MRAVSLLLTMLLPIAAAYAGGDPQAGKAQAVNCIGCHGSDGMSPNDIWPHLAGQNAAYLARQLRAYRSGKRSDPIMMTFARALTDQDIADLAAYYSSLPGMHTARKADRP